MAESAVNFLLEKVSVILAQEASLLRGIRNNVEEIKLELENMRAFLKDADRNKDSNEEVKTWVGQVRDSMHDVEDIIDEFLYRMDRPQRGGFKGFLLNTIRLPKNIYYRHQLATRLQETKVKVHGISERRNRYGLNQTEEGTSSYDTGERLWLRDVEVSLSIEDDDIVGVKKEFDLIVRWLLEEDQHLKVISVTGMGGLGKTTLVTKAFKHPQVQKNFDCYACVSVSQTLRINDLLRSILKQLVAAKKEMVINESVTMDNASDLRQMVRRHLQSKKYLIIVDDIWSISDWEKISSLFPDCKCGSRLMVTTRDVGLAHALGRGRFHCELQPLNQEEAWELFCKKTFQDESCPPELQQLARTILQKCEGLPLAILAMGGLLVTKEKNTVEWNNVLKSLYWELSHNVMLESLHSILLLSFYDLPYYLKHCFLSCTMFPEDYVIECTRLIRIWVAEGFAEKRGGMTMEEAAENHLKELIHRNMLQVAETNRSGRIKGCRMHDVMRQVALSLSSEEYFSMMYDDGQEAKQLTKVRRLSVCNGKEIIQSASSLLRLRSIIVFDGNMISSSSFLHAMASSFRLLRVLDLQDVPIKILPNELTSLFNLRYLSLRRTGIRKLPKSLGRLQNLQTLDVKYTELKIVPSGIVKLQKLHHIIWSPPIFDYGIGSIKVPIGICNITGMQTLKDIDAEGEEIVRQLGKLTQLRKLGIAKVKAIDAEELCISIRKMKHLLWLRISASDGEQLELESLSLNPSSFLQKLQLIGRLEKVPRWLSSLTNVTKLYLFSSQLREDENPLPSLQQLPNLVWLELIGAYQGQVLTFHDGWFPKLEFISFNNLTQLSRVVIEQRAMPRIKTIYLVGCGELKMIPQGIEYLTRLHLLYLQAMPIELVERLRLKDKNEEDRQKVGHIANIQHVVQKEEGGFNVEQLN